MKHKTSARWLSWTRVVPAYGHMPLALHVPTKALFYLQKPATKGSNSAQDWSLQLPFNAACHDAVGLGFFIYDLDPMASWHAALKGIWRLNSWALGSKTGFSRSMVVGDLGEPTHTHVPCWVPKPLPPRIECMGCLAPTISRWAWIWDSEIN